MNLDSDIYRIRINNKELTNLQTNCSEFYKNIVTPWAENTSYDLYAVKSGSYVQIILLDNQKVLKSIAFLTHTAKKYFKYNGDALHQHTTTYRNIKSYLQKQ